MDHAGVFVDGAASVNNSRKGATRCHGHEQQCNNQGKPDATLCWSFFKHLEPPVLGLTAISFQDAAFYYVLV